MCYNHVYKGYRLTRVLSGIVYVWAPMIVSFLISLFAYLMTFQNMREMVPIKLYKLLSFPGIIYICFLLPNLLPKYVESPAIFATSFILMHSIGFLNYFAYRDQNNQAPDDNMNTSIAASEASNLNESLSCLMQSTNYSLNYSGLKESISKKRQ